MLNAAETKAAASSVAAQKTGADPAGEENGLFAKELGTRLAELADTAASRNRITQAMEKFAGAFPGATVTANSMSGFSQVSSFYMEASSSATVNIDPEMMAMIAGDDEMFERVKSMIENLFSAGESQNLVDVGGSQSTRGVTISAQEVRYVEVQRDSRGTQLSVSSLALETQQMITDTLDQLLASRQGKSTGGTFDGSLLSLVSGSSRTQSWGFGNLVSSSSSWRMEAMITSENALNQVMQSQQRSLTSMQVIIQQWETSGTDADLFNYMQVMGLCDPLVFDLGDEGINLSSDADGVYFDIKGDGSPVQTAWIKGNNAFLYLDENGNGVADDANELFGDHGGFANGFEKLAQYDDNGDGVIDENDAIYSQLRLWRDLNGDGVNQADESMTLAEAGIKSINLGYQNKHRLDEHGNVIGEQSNFTRTDGSQGLVADVWLKNR